MPDNLKLRFSRVITSFQLCRSKNPLSVAHAPTPAVHRLSPFRPKSLLDVNYPDFPAPPPTTPSDLSPAKSHFSWKIVTLAHNLSSDRSNESMDFTCNNESEAKPRTYIRSRLSSYYDDCSLDVSPTSANEKDKTSLIPFDHSSCFSTEAFRGEETETLPFSSSSFSSGSSCEFVQSPYSKIDRSFAETQTLTRKKHGAAGNNNDIQNLGRQSSRRWRKSSNLTEEMTMASRQEIPSPLTASFFRRTTTCVADEKVKEGIAVVKKSNDPYADFKRSMLEMILEKQIFDVEALQELLQCFLRLNSRQHHGVIVEAFSEIWKVLFCESPSHNKKELLNTRLYKMLEARRG